MKRRAYNLSTQLTAKGGEHASWLKRLVPALDWLVHYERKNLPGDALAGVIVATLLIPQGMAYALWLPTLLVVALGVALLSVISGKK